MPLSELVVLGFDRLKVSEVVPFKATLAVANPFEIAGGNLAAGGVLPDADELPPQAAVQSELKAITRGKDTERAFIQNAGAFRSSLLLLVGVPHLSVLHLWFNVHLVIQVFDLVLGFLDLLEEVHFLLRPVVHLKAPVFPCEAVMRFTIQRIDSYCVLKMLDSFLRFLLHHQKSCQTQLGFYFAGSEFVGSLVVGEWPVQVGLRRC